MITSLFPPFGPQAAMAGLKRAVSYGVDHVTSSVPLVYCGCSACRSVTRRCCRSRAPTSQSGSSWASGGGRYPKLRGQYKIAKVASSSDPTLGPPTAASMTLSTSAEASVCLSCWICVRSLCPRSQRAQRLALRRSCSCRSSWTRL